MRTTLGFSLACLLAVSAFAAPPKEAPPITQEAGALKYTADDKGNRIPDYSYAGYCAGEAIPTVPAKVLAMTPEADNTARLQGAIDHVSRLSVREGGFRGAVLIPPGKYPVRGSLVIRTSGVVLRGSGFGESGTTLVATGTDRRTLIRIEGKADRTAGTELPIKERVAIGGMTLTMPADHGIKVGDTVLVRRPSTKEWIEAIGMDDLGGDRHGPSWKPGSRDLTWDRTVVGVKGDHITLDAPITCPIELADGGVVSIYTWPGRISNVGVENLRLESEFDTKNPKDEEHSWFAITMTNVADAFVRRVAMHHFVDGMAVWESAKRITVEDCKSLAPVSEIGGWRRNAFFTTGQQVLMQRLYSEDGLHDFAVGFTAAGPNAFVQCEAVRPMGESGAIDSFSAGTLFDNIRLDGRPLTLRNLTYLHQGAGWSATGSTLWNSSAAVIECWKVPGQMNWSLGCWGEFAGNGTWYGSNDSINPDSLYYAQLSERLGKKVDAKLLVVGSDASSSPTAAVAAQLIDEARQPMLRMGQWIDKLAEKAPIDVKSEGVSPILISVPELAAPVLHKLELRNGWLVADGAVLTGGRQGVPWWNMSIRPSELSKTQAALTRFVPGREGHGYTDDLTVVADEMVAKNKLAIEQHPPLWYERRRDDHERIQRAEGEVVAPFYEQPFARSGQGTAFDGLSKFDLTKPSGFYASRLNQFAGLADERGLVLIHQHYFQHSILEAGAHYADFPWRTANNINNPGFPEPPNYAGDKRIFMAEQFYDLSDEHRKALHRQYIRHALEMTAGRSNVVHLIGEEFTGPLPFVQFWVDTVAEWEKEKGVDVILGLSTTKDVQDAILADPVRAKAIDVIDIRYWWYQPDGTAYAPPGGQNLAPRQWIRQLKPKNPSAESAYKAVAEYKAKFPDKAVVYSVETAPDDSGWAALAAGGSLAKTPKLDAKIAQSLADGSSRLVFAGKGKVEVDLPAGQYTPRWLDGKTGQVSKELPAIAGGAKVSLEPAGQVLWLQRVEGVSRGN